MTRCIKILSLCIIFFSCDLSKEENKVENLNNESELLTKLPKVDFLEDFSNQFIEAVSYTHLTLPTNREV